MMRSSSVSLIASPAKYDILCGKDKTYNKHTGNGIFRDLIVDYVATYNQASSKQDKMKLTKEIVSHLQRKYGSRFIKIHKKTGQWQEISDQVARDKVSHALRFAAKHGHSDTEEELRRRRRVLANKPTRRSRTNVSVGSTSESSEDSDNASVESIYERQQAIYKDLKLVMPKITIPPPPVFPRPLYDFDRLRSADLDVLLNEPILSDEWDEAVQALAV